MEIKAKVQTNEYNVNLLVETEKSSNRHFSSYNKEVLVTAVLTDSEIIKLWKERKNDDEIELAKNWIREQEGYAISNCVDKTLNITYRSIVKYRCM